MKKSIKNLSGSQSEDFFVFYTFYEKSIDNFKYV